MMKWGQDLEDGEGDFTFYGVCPYNGKAKKPNISIDAEYPRLDGALQRGTDFKVAVVSSARTKVDALGSEMMYANWLSSGPKWSKKFKVSL